MMPRNIRFFCEREPWNMGAIAVYIRSVRNPHNEISETGPEISPAPMFALPMTFKLMTPELEGSRMEPAFTMQGGDAQLLMDELWRVGLRPTEGTGSAGAMAATERHLKDMQRLVFEDKEPRIEVIKREQP